MKRYRFAPALSTTVLTVILIPLLVGLGLWQLQRAEVKRAILANYEQRQQTPALKLDEVMSKKDPTFYRLKVVGRYDNAHPILVENKIVQHRVGYDVLLPFVVRNHPKAILVNQGWIPQPASPNDLPQIVPNKNLLALLGTVIVPEKSFMLGENVNEKSWPLRIQQVDIPALSQLTHHSLYPFVLSLAPQNPVQVKPAMHVGYAVQWFLMAAGILIFYLIKSFKKR